jgi:hypothetical protein
VTAVARADVSQLNGHAYEPTLPPVVLTPIHAMLYQLQRATDARFVNEVVNHPTVHPWVRGAHNGVIDLHDLVLNPYNVTLTAEHGAILFQCHTPGLYEAHTQVLPAGRGKWALYFVQAALMWMFTRTDAVEIVTRVPAGNRAAAALMNYICRLCGAEHDFRSPYGWTGSGGHQIAADVYSLPIQRWMRAAGGLAERGSWFHQRLDEEWLKIGKRRDDPHPDDTVHDRYVGAGCELMLGGQVRKALVFYNRFAVMSGYAPIELVCESPLAIDTHDAILLVRDNDFWLMSAR